MLIACAIRKVEQLLLRLFLASIAIDVSKYLAQAREGLANFVKSYIGPNALSFVEHASLMPKSINLKLFAIKKLFYLFRNYNIITKVI